MPVIFIEALSARPKTGLRALATGCTTKTEERLLCILQILALLVTPINMMPTVVLAGAYKGTQLQCLI